MIIITFQNGCSQRIKFSDKFLENNALDRMIIAKEIAHDIDPSYKLVNIIYG